MPLDFDAFPRAYIRRMDLISDADYGRLCLMTLSTKMLDRILHDVPGVDKRGVWIRKTVVEGNEATKGRRSFLYQIPRQYTGVTLVQAPEAYRRIAETSTAEDISSILLLLGHDAWIMGYVHRWYGNIAEEALANIRAASLTLPLAMGGHPRLGKESVLGWLDSAVLGMIAHCVVAE